MVARILATTATALALAAPAASAHARFSDAVVPYRSIGGVALKSTPSQIERRFGKPDAVFHENHRISGFQYDALEMQIDFDIYQKQDRAMLISANSRRLRSIKGIRIGTTESTLRHRLRAYTNLRCTKDLGCTITRGRGGSPGSSDTAFGIENGKVAGFVVSYVFNDG